MKFKNKIDQRFDLIAVFTLVFCTSVLIWLIQRNGNIIGIIYCCVAILICILASLLVHLVTAYVLQDSALYIRRGLFKNVCIAYKDIKEIKETKIPFTFKDYCFCALSRDRIEINYSESDTILISPKNEQEFIRQLNQRTI